MSKIFQSLAVSDAGASRAEELDFEVMLWPLRPKHVSRRGICSHPPKKFIKVYQSMILDTFR